jgi:hypothetical protein
MNHLKQISLNTNEKYSSWSANYGALLSADGTNIADALTGVPQGFKFVTENTIDADSAIELINVAKSSNTLTSKQTVNKIIQNVESACAPGMVTIFKECTEPLGWELFQNVVPTPVIFTTCEGGGTVIQYNDLNPYDIDVCLDKGKNCLSLTVTAIYAAITYGLCDDGGISGKIDINSKDDVNDITTAKSVIEDFISEIYQRNMIIDQYRRNGHENKGDHEVKRDTYGSTQSVRRHEDRHVEQAYTQIEEELEKVKMKYSERQKNKSCLTPEQASSMNESEIIERIDGYIMVTDLFTDVHPKLGNYYHNEYEVEGLQAAITSLRMLIKDIARKYNIEVDIPESH